MASLYDTVVNLVDEGGKAAIAAKVSRQSASEISVPTAAPPNALNNPPLLPEKSWMWYAVVGAGLLLGIYAITRG